MKSTQNAIMNKTLNIVIIDDDKFYTAGLAMALAIYLKNQGQQVEFSSHLAYGKTTDIVFQAIRCGTLIASGSAICMNNDKPVYVAIADRKDAHLQHLYRSVNKSNILYRHQSVSLILQLMENVMLSLQKTSVKTQSTSENLQHLALTQREREVLHQLKQGKTPACVASFLGIKEKTISSHKRAAMRKLNFKRSNELFHWMLQGGLTCHQPRKGI
ncbi:helix-turn-helix transcriptional regulator [Serratia marcescens]|uniref:Helix-turn-helix transcriptional regulator n=1 Tax=Serratia marcescens TaxID=615 RepID=A0A5C7CHA8_SERMA|nr:MULTISPECIES: helix-turn-helix transcriptional regulator [Serratia]MBH2575675.1 helix-turn-helix transcriptional regulator [Serratia marcescens]MBH3076145.1 helix-turn-helix transcriptional regulator [Serratia ureilytica]MBN5249579.1 helix-turn-helix transcriptional regulator [Serratia marcescens]MBN5258788.1 helix-turn-helix transcriptional regulator [Serratia marcescens]MBN5354353.1 helix-turn-helix transcriptional regulator [Serratia marcescens]